MSKDFLYLRNWLTGGTYSPYCPQRPVILEAIPSRSGMSMGVYDRGERIFTINGCGFDRIGAALGEFLETLFQDELWKADVVAKRLYGAAYAGGPARDGFSPTRIHLDGVSGVESMTAVADAIGLKVQLSESKAGTLILINKKGN